MQLAYLRVHLLRCFFAISPLIMVRFSKFKISLEAVNALYLLIWLAKVMQMRFCVIARGVLF